jgi:AhpD family alkylhydroperoxidase
VTASVLIAPLSGFSETDEQGKSRAEIYAEMESALGLVPTFFKSIPDSTLELEWELMKGVQMAPGPIPNKYRELIGVAVAAATKCEYCIIFHTEFARLNGATKEEIQDALHYTKSTTGWSTYINGSQVDLDLFRAEVDAIVKHVSEQAASAEK